METKVYSSSVKISDTVEKETLQWDFLRGLNTRVKLKMLYPDEHDVYNHFSQEKN